MGPFLGAVITVVVIIAGLVQALAPVFKSISEANERARRQSMPNAGGARGGNRSDPGSFLPDMTQQGMPRPAAGASRPAKVPRSSEKTAAARRQSARPNKRQQGIAGEKSAQKSGQAAQSRGSGVGAHVDSYIGQHVKSHIGHQIGDAVKNDISDQVRSHLGEDRNKPSAPVAATTHGSVAAGDLLSALRSPEGVRQAIMISEVLSKPKALRRS